MKTIVIYNSQTGFTKCYAEWIAEDLSCECVSFKEKNKVNLAEYAQVIFGSWFHAGNILKKNWILEEAKKNPQKKYVVFATGASPATSKDIPVAMENNFPEGCGVQGFYMQGGLAYDKMGFVSKTMMKMLCSMMEKKKGRTPEEDEMLAGISHSFDGTDRKYIAEIVEACR